MFAEFCLNFYSLFVKILIKSSFFHFLVFFLNCECNQSFVF